MKMEIKDIVTPEMIKQLEVIKESAESLAVIAKNLKTIGIELDNYVNAEKLTADMSKRALQIFGGE